MSCVSLGRWTPSRARAKSSQGSWRARPLAAAAAAVQLLLRPCRAGRVHSPPRRRTGCRCLMGCRRRRASLTAAASQPLRPLGRRRRRGVLAPCPRGFLPPGRRRSPRPWLGLRGCLSLHQRRRLGGCRGPRPRPQARAPQTEARRASRMRSTERRRSLRWRVLAQRRTRRRRVSTRRRRESTRKRVSSRRRAARGARD